MSSRSEALTIITSETPAKVNAVHFCQRNGKRIAKRIQEISRSEHDAAFNAIGIGLLLWQIKAAVKHGTFQLWIHEYLGESSYRSAAFYMKLALRFAEKASLTRAECLALPDMKPTGAKGGPAEVAFGKIEKFIGEHSLTDLMVMHGVRRNAQPEIEGDDAQSAVTDGTAGEQMLFSEVAEHFAGLRNTLLKPENLMRLRPEQLDAINVEMESATARWRKLYKEARGNGVEAL